ncbi:MAG TPA: glycosyltransferase family 1 protein [Anaerolineae bacterium]|nr:glycosyltransferase family 1 protein [Anaerolineae bacterium]
MHIGLNAHLLSLTETYRGAGINCYIRNLLAHLPRVDGDNRYTAFLGDRRFAADPSPSLRFSRLPTARPPVRILWEQAVQPWALKKEGVDLLHALAFVAPLLSPCPFVVTIYDLGFLLHPKSFKPLKRLYLSLFTRLSARRARRVIAISESTKRDVVRLLEVPPERVDVVYCGVDGAFRPLPAERVAAFRRRRGLPERFILFVGTLEPRKNVGRLIEAFSLLRGRATNLQTCKLANLKLVIGGAKGWMYGDIFARVEELGLRDEVLFPGYIPFEELPLWYNAAELFVYPSLHEGFGLPVLEAMACGTPVVASQTSSLPEVVGEAGMLVDPRDIGGLAEAMERALMDEGRRREMRERGLRRAAGFSWERTARETAQVYRRAMESGGS